eukprot:scaffold61359_cov34-Phaeocystis_antarctica.AAC.2
MLLAARPGPGLDLPSHACGEQRVAPGEQRGDRLQVQLRRRHRQEARHRLEGRRRHHRQHRRPLGGLRGLRGPVA